jgi:hypothetical protein
MAMTGASAPLRDGERHDDAVGRLEAARAEQDRRRDRHEAALGTSLEHNAHARLCEANERVAAGEKWLEWIDQHADRGRPRALSEEDEMTPVQFFEGTRTQQERTDQRHHLVERRLAALALAVRQHEDAARRRSASPARSHDRHLYTRLRQILDER